MKLFNKKKKSNQEEYGKDYEKNIGPKTSPNDYIYKPIYSTVKENIDYIKQIQAKSWDLVTREIELENKFQKLKIGLAFYAGMVDQRLLNKAVIDSIGENFQKVKIELKSEEDRFNYFKKTILTVIGVDDAENYGKLFNTLLSGDMILFIEGIKKCIIIGARLYQERSVEKPTTETTVKGPKDSFNENLLTNVTLIRKRIKNPNFIVKNYIIGEESNTNVALLYINGLVNENILKEVTRRIESIQAPNIIDIGYLCEYLGEKEFSLFPTIYDTERPDVVCGNLFEGRVAVIMDNSPFAMIFPVLFIQFIQISEDFYQKTYVASFFRLIRLFGFFLSLFLPGLYLCLVLHHSELLPINLLFSIAGQRSDVPFPSYIELFLMLLLFDLLREAGTRMPVALGSTLSFVGAIIIGQSAVEAGLISPIIVIIVVLSGMGSLVIPNYKMNLRITTIKYMITLFAALFGLYGISISYIILIVHLCKIRSCGIDYFSPFAPVSKSGMKDSIVRFPLKNLMKRPRQSSSQFPH